MAVKFGFWINQIKAAYGTGMNNMVEKIAGLLEIHTDGVNIETNIYISFISLWKDFISVSVFG